MAVMDSEDSSSALPARMVFLKNKRSSQAERLGMAMPTYTIAEDPPWVTDRASHAPTASSIYSDEYDEHAPPVPAHDKLSYHPSYHAHPQQQIMDSGPQLRPSRLPIFKQVRSMLHKPPPLVTPDNARWDDFSGELSDSGKPAQVNPSTYVSPYDKVFRSRKRSPERRGAQQTREASPAFSVLQDDEVKPPPPLRLGRNTRSLSPVSPISPVSASDFRVPSPQFNHDRPQPSLSLAPPSVKLIKRKPTPSSIVITKENVEPQRSPSVNSDWTEPPDDDEPERKQADESHFSWTTYAASEAPGRPSTDSRHTKQSTAADRDPRSHFSWSTVNTVATHQRRVEPRPPSPPPPIPNKYSAPNTPQTYSPRGMPVQSILSRQRPIQRIEKTGWTPPARKSSNTPTPHSATTPASSNTPLSVVHPALRGTSPFSASTTTIHKDGSKRLPPPPTPTEPISHLETLLATEKDLVHQRRNIEKGILELEKIQKASPMEVSWSTVQEAKKRLEEQRHRLAELNCEEREVGVRIARVRRKEGEGCEEGLWVRRVTG
ncbi:hypothetical protein LTR78_000943 [Recurvomyces mirabilis]|uniref:Uncharacterized protein n=1 Tax=Recurvomyces mirabilis TaxID=574656 RepID=A0AAE0WW38_9PEZI|nr:hypothetical protein LTR78_000943 [Recurvomyces mirabilis]KAK5158915.1 hypothetical protein LTS14_003023 [Recurvomyces mirabilis]